VIEGMELVMQIAEWLIVPFTVPRAFGAGFHHRYQIEQCLDLIRTLRLLGNFLPRRTVGEVDTG